MVWLQSQSMAREEYIGFVCKFMLGMGLGLKACHHSDVSKLGILSYSMLKTPGVM